MTKLSVLLPLSALVVLGGCVTVPVGPAVRVMPGTGKSFDQFQADDGNCRQYAYASIGGPDAARQGQDNGRGKRRDRLRDWRRSGRCDRRRDGPGRTRRGDRCRHGSAVRQRRRCERRGILVLPTAAQYDTAYMQCMYARGNQVPGRMAYRSSMPVYSYPPQSNPVPPGVPESAPPLNYPPPNTPPPRS